MRRHKMAISFAVYGAILITAYQNFSSAPASLIPDCNPRQIQEVLEQATPEKPEVSVRCNLKLRHENVVSKRIVLAGARASGVVIDCGGGSLFGGLVNTGKDLIHIRTEKKEMPSGEIIWSQPKNVKIKNCNVHGSIRIASSDPTQIEEELTSQESVQMSEIASKSFGGISFENLTIYGHRKIFWGE